MNALSHRIRLGALVVGCVLLALVPIVFRSTALAPSALLGLWLLACVIGEAFWTPAPGGEGTISMALALNIAALAILGDKGGVEVVAASTLIAGFYPHRRAWYKVLFNAAQSALAATVALLVAQLAVFDIRSFTVPTSPWWPGLLLMGATFFLINTVLVASAISLATSRPLWRTWREDFCYPFELASSLAQVTLAGFLVTAYSQLGAMTLLFVLPLIAVLGFSSAREAKVRAVNASVTRDPVRLRRAG
jgi:hypothetical protein